jgi:prepilin-type N-terminal cleavage/methylation domain-containing protein
MKRKSGFTLIELMSVIAITSVILASLGSLMMGAFQVVKALDSRKTAVMEKALIALEKMSREAQKSSVYPSIPFKGTATSISFPALVALSGGEAIAADFKLGQVQDATMGKIYEFQKIEYYFDPAKKSLMRKVGEAAPEVLADNVQEVTFSYALRSLTDRNWKWEERTPDSLAAVRLEAVGVRLLWDPEVYRYTIPGVKKTFLLTRFHPLNGIPLTAEPETL